MSLVLDASMALAWLLDDESNEASQSVLRLVAINGAVVPSLWRLEVANVLQHSVRRKRCDQALVERGLLRLERFRIFVDPETDEHAWGETRRLAIKHGLTIYDAAYLELAIRRGLPLASCDAELIAAAKKAGVEVVP
ncbi:MAG: type II toxin-antitoxin system VapC family toxin [Alphaproteobacteria bacterium]|nr:type II toxin-antitoxin system VapC family toxin [Alphaproteobacteria bacterium]MBF0356090.1 type II toxin-antitoxin system VapC family toxin [Alphaproteobacteria bacterium]